MCSRCILKRCSLFKCDPIAVPLYIQQYVEHNLSDIALISYSFIQKIQA